MKILVIHASAGAGHFKAAQALYEGFKKSTSHETLLVDSLDYTSPFFKIFYQRTYSIFVTRLPWLWALFFKILDFEWFRIFWQMPRRIYNHFNGRKLYDFLIKENFDYVLTTHFLPSEVVSALKKSGRIRSKLVTVVTDFDVHKIWLNPETDIYAVASEWTRQKLQRLGVKDEKIRVTGIPVAEEFGHPGDRTALKHRLGLKEDAFTVLVATGSFGVGPIEEILHALEGEFQTVVVCGYNKSLFKRLMAQNYKSAKILGLVDNMHELMAASDVMVTKPGGLSISEALASQLPMVFFHPIPGQEEHNIKVLHEHGVGCRPKDIAGIAAELKKLKSSRDAHLTAVKNTQQLARPAAVRNIISLIN